MQYISDHAGTIIPLLFGGVVLGLILFFKGFKPGNNDHSSDA